MLLSQGDPSWTVGMMLLWVLGTSILAALVLIGIDLSHRRRP